MSVTRPTVSWVDVARLTCLVLGADDYVTQPFSPRELVARVRALPRRAEGEGTYSPTIRSGDLTIDLERRTVRNGSTPVDLTATEFDFLSALALHPGRPFTRSQFVEIAYNNSFYGSDRTIAANLSDRPRNIAGPEGQTTRYVVMVNCMGCV